MFQTEQGDTVAGTVQVNERVEWGEVREVMEEEIVTGTQPEVLGAIVENVAFILRELGI